MEINWILFRFPGMETADAWRFLIKGDVWIGMRETASFFWMESCGNQVAIETCPIGFNCPARPGEVTTDSGNVSITGPYWASIYQADGLTSNTINNIYCKDGEPG